MAKRPPHKFRKEIDRYLGVGFSPIPVPLGAKAPVIKDWTKLRVTKETVAQYFPEPSNVGILLGAASDGLVDIDLDCDEAISFAAELLPQTGAVFGRASRLGSHWLYRCEPAPEKTIKLVDENRHSVIELRSNGSQTIFPPSVHTSGENIAWEKRGDPSPVKEGEIVAAVRLVAAAVILSRHYPSQGSRHDFTLTVANLLARAGYDEQVSRDFLLTLATNANDEEAPERMRSPAYSARRLEEGGPAHGLPYLANLIGDEPVKALAKIFGLEHRKAGKQSQRELLYHAVLPTVELWRTADEVAYASIEVEGHREHHRIRSRSFRRWLMRRALDINQRGVGRGALDEVIDMMEATAFRGAEYEAHMRVGEHDGVLFIDLVDREWRAVRITDSGWNVASSPPIRFVRSPGMMPLPTPEGDGSLDDLRPFVNVASDDDFLLLLGVIIGALRPKGPHVIVAVNGEQGSAKTTLMRLMRTLIDPNKAPTRAQPRSEEDLYVAAVNAYLLSFDNVSYLTGAMSDALCRIATGGGFSKRQLYTDLEEIIVDVCRPVLLNGIPSLLERPDLMDRAITFTLPRIDPDQRQTEGDFWDGFERARPAIFGAICDALSAGLRYRHEVVLDELPRMADLVIFMTAVERGLGQEEGAFARAYNKNLRTAMIDLAAADPLVDAILKVIANKTFSGTATELLRKIREVLPDRDRPPRGIPRLPNRLSGALRRLAPALRELGIDVDLGSGRDEANRRVIEIRHINEEPF